MAVDDDDRGKKDNTGRELKPEHARDNANAPRGAIGTTRTFGPSLGMGGTKQAHSTTQAAEQTPSKEQGDRSQAPDRHHDPAKDTRPVFHETEDKATNDFYKQSHRMIPKDEPARGVSAEGPKRSQSNFARAFHQAGGAGRSQDRDRGL
jgi:hypothetical protein